MQTAQIQGKLRWIHSFCEVLTLARFFKELDILTNKQQQSIVELHPYEYNIFHKDIPQRELLYDFDCD